MATKTELAAHYRRHRQAFELALELGVTPREAEAELRRIEARERERAAADRLEAKRNAPIPPANPQRAIVTPYDDQHWMMRN